MNDYEKALKTIGEVRLRNNHGEVYGNVKLKYDMSYAKLQELVFRDNPMPPKVFQEKFDGINYKTQICRKCGCKPDEDDRNFCPECGQSLRKKMG